MPWISTPGEVWVLPDPVLSVIIPVYNAGQRLRLCLDPIFNQSFEEDYEVVVVDNNSTDETAEVASEYPVVLTAETKQSSYAARNRGIQVASAPLLVFTDADCRPTPGWLAAYLQQHRATRAQLMGGAVRVTRQSPDNTIEIYDKMNHLQQATYVTQGYAATANVFATREVFEKVGPFESDLISNGDREFTSRASAEFGIEFCADAVVEHPARRTLDSLMRKNRRIGIGMVQRMALHGDGRRAIFSRDGVLGALPNLAYLNPDSELRDFIKHRDPIGRMVMRWEMLLTDFFVKMARLSGKFKGLADLP